MLSLSSSEMSEYAEDMIKSGALLACGIVNCGVRNECDPALALLSDYVLHNNNANGQDEAGVPSNELARMAISYAREMEQIV